MIVKQLSIMEELQWAKKRMFQKLKPVTRTSGQEGAWAFWEMASNPDTRSEFLKYYAQISMKVKDEEAEQRERKRDERAIQTVIDKLLKCKGE